jgi:uncharacterized protein (TIGR03083 family)
MHPPRPILAAHLLRPVNDALVSLLRELRADEWAAPTVAGEWTVKDVAGHLLDTTLRRLSIHRDGHMPPGAFEPNRANDEGVRFARRLSPSLMIELHERHGAEMAEFLASLDPYAPAQWGVSWAGEAESQNWFDVARELTERWHHQQQIRDAAGREPLDEFLPPVIETFVRALPFTYRDVDASDGTALVVKIDAATWSLVREENWRLYDGEADKPATVITLSGDKAWRIFTRQKIDPRATVEGDARYAQPLLKMVTVI